MYFSSWADFLNMDGHGLYVWSAYGVALVVISYNIIAPIRHKRRLKAQVRRQVRLDATKKQQSGVEEHLLRQNAVQQNAVGSNQ